MKQATSTALTNDLLQVTKQLTRLKLRKTSVAELTRSEQGLLMVLALNLDDDRKTLKATELSKLLHITPAAVTHFINVLEDAGYVERLRDKQDRRAVFIGLTKKGAKVAENLISGAQEQLVGLVKHLGEEDSRALIRLASAAIQFLAAQPDKAIND